MQLAYCKWARVHRYFRDVKLRKHKADSSSIVSREICVTMSSFHSCLSACHFSSFPGMIGTCMQCIQIK